MSRSVRNVPLFPFPLLRHQGMRMKIQSIAATAALTVASFCAEHVVAQKPVKPPLESHIWKAEDARRSTGAWGGSLSTRRMASRARVRRAC